jgi:transposase
MKIKETIGIDISKLTFDVVVHTSKAYQSFKNSKKGISEMISWVFKNTTHQKENVIFVFEHTGLYSHQMAVVLTEKALAFCMVPGLEIKRSLGMARGKNDKKDASKIAQYAYRLRDEIQPSKLSSKDIENLKRLLSLRDRLVKQRSGYKTSLKEQKRILSKEDAKELFKIQERLISALDNEIDVIEKELIEVIKKSPEMKKNFDLILTIKGVGKVTAIFFIAYTENFTKFENARRFNSYCGIAPFENSSGTSVRGKTRVSNLANKQLKTLLDLCAKSSITHNPEMKEYYERRIAEGKNKMSTINIIRNKIVARVFAVIKRKQGYVDLMKYAA